MQQRMFVTIANNVDTNIEYHFNMQQRYSFTLVFWIWVFSDDEWIFKLNAKFLFDSPGYNLGSFYQTF